MTGTHEPAQPRLLARLALLGAAGAIASLLAAIGPAGLLIPLLGALGLAVSAAGAWLVVAHRGVLRVVGAVLMWGAPATVMAAFAAADVWGPVLLALLLWGAALAAERSALRREQQAERMPAAPAAPPRHPVLIMNPRSGGGKVARFGLIEKAERLGARVLLLDPGAPADVAALAAEAADQGADLLGVAGGDGTQALVAAVAADRGLPFLVVSAGTRNHFAMDLGLDRVDPSRCLDALADGVELRVDLGDVDGRPFVNTVSFGAYARVVQSPRYRDAKAATALDLLPDLLVGHLDERLDAVADGQRLAAQQALLVSNNAYTGDPLAIGRRTRLDRGVLGVLGIRVESAAQAAGLAVRGGQAPGVRVLTADRVVIGPDERRTVPVAVDGEALTLSTPVLCTVRRRALRVRVPAERPGAAAPLGRPRTIALAFRRRPRTPGGDEPAGAPPTAPVRARSGRP